jgi:hypothetical protein
MADLAQGSQEGEPASKRTHLESVIPAPPPASKMGQQKDSRQRRRCQGRAHRHSGSPDSCCRHSGYEEPATRTPHTGGREGQLGATRAAAATALDAATEAPRRAASMAAGDAASIKRSDRKSAKMSESKKRGLYISNHTVLRKAMTNQTIHSVAKCLLNIRYHYRKYCNANF